jgi:hypothetical protein
MSILTPFLLLVLLFSNSQISVAQQQKQVSHVVLVWLKQPGNEAMRKQFLDNSQRLSKLPGIINRHVGVAMVSERQIVDDSFDVAITVTLKNKAALDAYLNNPEHKKIVQGNKPLVGKIIAYDIISQ